MSEPTEAQKAAGNYKKDHIRIHGLMVTIENRRGSERSGKDPDGKPWSVKMPAHYGYIKRTEGADGDHVDVYVGPNPMSDKAYIINQNDLGSGKFDEHKVILGCHSYDEAKALYHKGFSDGHGVERIGSIVEKTIPQLKEWLKGDTTVKARALGGRISRAEGGSVRQSMKDWHAEIGRAHV